MYIVYLILSGTPENPLQYSRNYNSLISRWFIIVSVYNVHELHHYNNNNLLCFGRCSSYDKSYLIACCLSILMLGPINSGSCRFDCSLLSAMYLHYITINNDETFDRRCGAWDCSCPFLPIVWTVNHGKVGNARANVTRNIDNKRIFIALLILPRQCYISIFRKLHTSSKCRQ